jgi:hypothetical protein
MKIQVASLVVAICLCLSQALGAYELPLDARALHEAWEVGQRNDQETGNFLAHYLKKISGGENDPYTAEIEVLKHYSCSGQGSRGWRYAGNGTYPYSSHIGGCLEIGFHERPNESAHPANFAVWP